MSAGVFFCQAHEATAIEFCLCDKNPVYLCSDCLPKHWDNSPHVHFPIACFGLYRALGSNKAELVRRIETVKICSEFLDNASAREAAVLSEANNLITDLARCYQGWLENNHHCFTNLLELLRDEISALMTTPEISLSHLSQILTERSHLLGAQEENILCFIPENSLKDIVRHCNQALSKTRRLQQQEYENEVLQAFMKLPKAVQQSSTHSVSQVPAKDDVQKLIAVLEGEVMYFDEIASRWQKLLSLGKKIQVSGCSSSTFIAPNSIIVCGGGKDTNACTPHVGNNAYLLEGDGSVQELPHMLTGRRYHGQLWDWDRKALYIFGGFDGRGTYNTGYTKKSETFQSNEWSTLPDMHSPRCWFNPCWHSSLVYLCGGVANSIETYDPSTSTFNLQNLDMPENCSFTTAVVQSGELIMISNNAISRLQQGRFTSQKHGILNPWSNCTPVVSGGVVYVNTGSQCVCIDLSSGEVLREVGLS